MPETNAAPAVEEKKKIIIEYQHTDENGQPILDARGRPTITNLVADTWEEMAEKQKKQNIEVTRALWRARNHKPVMRQPEVPAKELTPEEERQAAADLQDPTKARSAIRKLSGADQAEEDRKRAREKEDAAEAQRAAYQFMSNHLNDYYPCQANSAILSKYIADNNLDPRVADNYEVAFQSVYHDLAQRPVITPAPAPSPIEDVPPKKQAGGIQPGQLSGTRPTIQKPKGPFSFTKKEINDMPREAYRANLRKTGFKEYVDALFAG